MVSQTFPVLSLLKWETPLKASHNLSPPFSLFFLPPPPPSSSPPPSSLTHRKQDGRIPRISDEVEPSLAQSHPPFPLPSLSKVTRDFDPPPLSPPLSSPGFAFRTAAGIRYRDCQEIHSKVTYLKLIWGFCSLNGVRNDYRKQAKSLTRLTGTLEWNNRAIINVISYTCAFPVMTSPNVCQGYYICLMEDDYYSWPIAPSCLFKG